MFQNLVWQCRNGKTPFCVLQRDIELSMATEFAKLRKEKKKSLTLMAYWVKDEMKNEHWNLWLVGKDKKRFDWISLGLNSTDEARKKLEEIDKKTGETYQLKKEFELIVRKNNFMKKIKNGVLNE